MEPTRNRYNTLANDFIETIQKSQEEQDILKSRSSLKPFKRSKTSNMRDLVLNQSWDFTPFPKFLFPSEKKSFIKDFNRFNFPGIKEDQKSLSALRLNTEISQSNNLDFIQEIKGDATKSRAPAYTFGNSRLDCKVPFVDFPEKICPAPGSYNLRPLNGFNFFSPKYSFKKSGTNKSVNGTGYCSPGPGKYYYNQCDIVNQGRYPLSTYINTPFSGFGKYTESRSKEFNSQFGYNMKGEPASYNVDSAVTMFSGNGRYPVSYFKSNISKTIPNAGKFTRCFAHKAYVSPGPGSYNHHSQFIGGRYSK